MMFTGNSEGRPLKGSTADQQIVIDDKIAKIQATASHCHFNCDFQFNSQSTGMQFTPRRTIGGRAWLSILLATPEQEKALVLWANTSLGLLLHWRHANKQQVGRGCIGRSTLRTLPILDVSALDKTQIDEAVRLFDVMKERQLLPVHQIDVDAVRQELDERFARDVLGLAQPIFASGGPLELLKMKLAQEPSIRGRK